MSRTEAERVEPGASPSAADAELAVARMGEMSPDLRGCAVLTGGGEVLAASDAGDWAKAGAGFLAAADAAGDEPAKHVHVATEDGEAFAVREGDLAMVAVTERFTLSSLVLFDMRTILRDLVAGKGIPDRRAPTPPPRPAAEGEGDGEARGAA